MNGDSHMDFEFNAAGIQQTGTTSGLLIGQGPLGGRTIGDFVVSVDFANGGTVPGISVRRWTAAAVYDIMMADPAYEPEAEP